MLVAQLGEHEGTCCCEALRQLVTSDAGRACMHAYPEQLSSTSASQASSSIVKVHSHQVAKRSHVAALGNLWHVLKADVGQLLDDLGSCLGPLLAPFLNTSRSKLELLGQPQSHS